MRLLSKRFVQCPPRTAFSMPPNTIGSAECCWTRAFGFVNVPARCRVASHAPLCRTSYAECHTAQVVSRDVGFRPAVPLPAVVILLRTLSTARLPVSHKA